MILVTGATGTVGSQLLQALLQTGASVRAAVHARPLEIAGVETCTIDYDRPETLPPALEDSGLAWTFLRPNFLMQNFVTYMGGLIAEEGAIYEPAGDARVSYIDAGDIGRVAARALTEPGHRGGAYDLSGPQALTHDEVAEHLTEALGRTIRHVRVSDDTYRYGRTGALSTVTTHVADLTGRPPRAFGGFCRDHASLLAADRSAPAGR